MSTTETYTVTGMTCEHCVNAVTEEIKKIDGVDSVQIELNAGAASPVRVVSAGPLSVESVREAVDEAGYELVAPTR